jgi:D-alanyl-D-alanine carboxypeptidase
MQADIKSNHRTGTIAVLIATVLVVLAISAAGYDVLSGRLGTVPAQAGPLVPTGPASAEPTTPSGPTATGTAGLKPALQRALDRAIAAAGTDGVELRLTSGWRTRAEQQQLFDAAVKKYGSRQKASRWVLPPDESAHVRGEAVDVGPRAGAKWLERHGSRFGLCRRYDNEWWHFELLTTPGGTCPAREANAAG